MREKILTFMEKHHLLEKDKTVLVAVSGGPDSMALLHFLAEIRSTWNLKVIALTVDHQLRGEESIKDVVYVSEVCKKWDIPHITVAVDVDAYKRVYKVSTQVAARTLRYDAFFKQMKKTNADYLAMGHHGDDQIETMIMSLTRTTTLTSLTGIPVQRPFAQGKIIRPLLCVTKSEIEAYCTAYHIKPRLDASNLDTYYTRNYVRSFIVPKLKEKNHRLHATIQQLSETLQEDEQYFMEQAKEIVKKVSTYDPKQRKVTLSIRSLNCYPPSLQRRTYRLTLDYLYDELPLDLSYTHEQIFLSLLNGEAENQIVHFPKGLMIEKSYDQLFFYFMDEQRSSTPFHQEIQQIPQTVILPNEAVLSVNYIEENEMKKRKSHRFTYICPEEQLNFPLHVRTRKPGDRMSYKGLKGTKKIKDIFIDEKVPRHVRDMTYILTDDTDTIFWLIGLRKKEINDTHHVGRYISFEYKQMNGHFKEE